jgi:tRNA (mo5U34)-methyltransferase
MPPVVSEAPTEGAHIAINADLTSEPPDPAAGELGNATPSMTAAMGSLPPSEGPPEPTAAERQVADLIPIEADPEIARAVLDRVPLWFHTFSLDGSKELYTHGVARDHRYRIPALPEDFGGMSVLDVGTFDGFYAFLAEARGARRVVAVDNEQYREWVSSRWGVELEGGEGFAAIRELLDSEVDYRRLDAFDLDELAERFDLILCFGILHRVENPMGLLKTLRRRLAAGGRVLLETHGPADRALESWAAVHIPSAGEVYARDDFVYWGSPRQVWTRWPGMLRGLRADRRAGDRRPSACARGAPIRPARLNRTGACPPAFGSFFKFGLRLTGQDAIDLELPRPRDRFGRNVQAQGEDDGRQPERPAHVRRPHFKLDSLV